MVDTINLAQAYKWNCNQAKTLEVLASEDWSGVSDEFSLAVAVLKDKFDEATSVMMKMGSNGKIDRGDFTRGRFFESSENLTSSRKRTERYTEILQRSLPRLKRNSKPN
jgi:hypothetical protein